MFISLPELVEERVPEILQEDPTQDSTSQISSPRVLAALNAEYQELTQLGQGNDRPELLAWQDFGLDNGLLDAVIPDKLGKWIMLTAATSDVPTLDEVAAVYVYRRTKRTETKYAPIVWERYRDTVRIFNSTAAIIRVWYLMNVPALHYGAMGAGTIGSNEELWVNRSPTTGRFDPTLNAYLHSRVHIYAGTGLDKFGRISAIDNTFPTPEFGRLATITWDPSSTGGADLDSTTRYALVPWLPIQFSELLAYGAARRFRKRVGASMIQSDYAALRERLEEWLPNIDLSSPRPFIETGYTSLGLGSGGMV